MRKLTINDAAELVPTRQSLLSRLKDWGDEESYRDFFNTYWKLIYSAAIRAGLTDAEAQDVVQETVIGVARRMPGFVYDPSKGSFKTFLMRQTDWRIFDQFRKRMPVQQLNSADTSTGTSEFERLPDPAAPPLDKVWDEEWEKNLLEAAVQRVKAKVDGKQYQIFDLYFRHKWPVSRIAKDLKITSARVYLAKHRIGKLIKQEVLQLRTNPV
jgi:RNA polymerase sigma-70 factor (ECF subfamily)